MNLYEVMLQHYSQKDSEKGIFTYLVGNSDEDVYEWLKSRPTLSDGRWVTTPYHDREHDNEIYSIYDDDFNIIGHENSKRRIIRLKGDMNDESANLDDLYYGKTLFGWRLAQEDVKSDILQIIKDCGISIELASP